MAKLCMMCGSEEVRQKYCSTCRRNRTLHRLHVKWQSDAEYRERHRVAAKMSFRKLRGTDAA